VRVDPPAPDGFLPIVLTRLDEQPVTINALWIRHMYSRLTELNGARYFLPGVECRIHTAQGKLFEVRETCDHIKGVLEGMGLVSTPIPCYPLLACDRGINGRWVAKSQMKGML